jgi:hypothetical protein
MFSQDIVAADHRVYVTNETNAYPFAVTILDVTDPTGPVVLGGVPTGDVGVAHTVWLDGTLLALASQVTKAIHLYDVSDPEGPVALSSIHALNATAHDIHVRDGRLYGSYMALAAGQDAELVVACPRPASGRTSGPLSGRGTTHPVADRNGAIFMSRTRS